jgi:sugar phosphate isomerase/epimerase
MKLSVSNISLPPLKHKAYLGKIRDLGVESIEIAPSRRWKNTWHGLKAKDVQNYRQEIEGAGLTVCGLHSLFFDQPDLSIFGNQKTRERTRSFLIHLSQICRDLGGRTLIFGSPSARNRDQISEIEAFNIAAEFLTELCLKIKPHETVLCMESLPKADTNFLNSVLENLRLLEVVDNNALGLHLDLRAMVSNNEVNNHLISKIVPLLCHVHINSSNLGVFQLEDRLNCKQLLDLLHANFYTGMVSLEQRMVRSDNIIKPIKKSISFIKEIISKHG